MGIPHIVPPCVEVLPVNRNDFGVVPARAASPCPNPKANIGILGQVGREHVANAVAVGRLSDNVAKHHPDNHRALPFLRILHYRRQRPLESFHELPVRGSQAKHIGPNPCPSQYLPHFLWEEVAVSLLGTRSAIPPPPWRLVQLPHDAAGRDVPQTVVMLGMLHAQDLVRRRAHVGEFGGVLVLGGFPPRQLEEDPAVGSEEVVVDLAMHLQRLGVQVQLVELDFAPAELVVEADVFVHDRDRELHVLEGGKFEPEVLVVGRVGFVLLLGGDHFAEILVEDEVVLLDLELHVGVGLVEAIPIAEVGGVG
mmetsp:Transcript_57846/g.122697  ORF Transcript_57846/g.122697 Transcript_57846/m.122697 type:complete len:309 (-) Transcript_57846:147-1073(-)